MFNPLGSMARALRARRVLVAPILLTAAVAACLPGPPDGAWNQLGDLSQGGTVGPKSVALLELDADVLDFGTNLSRRWVGIRGSRHASLTYVIVSDADWVSAHVEPADPSDDATPLVVEIDRARLAPGVHTARVTIGANAVDPLVLTVRATQPEAGAHSAAVLAVNPLVLDFGESVVELAIEVQNAGAGRLAYTVRTNAAWAALAQTTGDTAGEVDAIHVRAARDGLAPGSYAGWIEVAADNGQVGVVNLHMSVAQPDPGDVPGDDDPPPPDGGDGGNDGGNGGNDDDGSGDGGSGGDSGGDGSSDGGEQPPPPLIELSRSAIDFGTAGVSETFTVRNAGGGQLDYGIAPDVRWLRIQPNYGSSTGEEDTITVTLDREALWYRPYRGTVTVSARGLASRTIDVTADVYAFDQGGLPVFGLFANPYLIPWDEPVDQPVDPIRVRSWFWDVRAQDRWNQANREDSLRFIARLHQELPGSKLGRYVSGTNALPQGTNQRFPLLLEVPDDWFLRRRDGSYFELCYDEDGCRRVVDLTIPEARAAMIDFWITNAAGWDFVAADNFIYKYTDLFDDCEHGSAAYFAGVQSLLREYSQRPDRLPLVINVATLPERTWHELTPYVDGLMMEFAFASIRTSWPPSRLERTKGEMDAFRAALDAGKTVLIVNKETTIQDAGRILSAGVCLVRNRDDRLYFNPNTAARMDYTHYDFYDWWTRLGAPRGPCVWNGMVCSRDFENGRVVLDITTTEPLIEVTFTDAD